MWLSVAIFGHLLNGLAFLLDKFLISKRIPQPAVYAFFVCALGGLAVVLLPFDPVIPASLRMWLQDFAAGATFFVALLLFFTALARGEVSRLVPFVGGLIPLFTAGLAAIILHERLMLPEWLGVGILILGTILVAQENGQRRRVPLSVYGYGLAAALCFAVSAVLMKTIFIEQSFISGFVWSRLGAALAAFTVLVFPSVRRAIWTRPTKSSGRESTRWLFLAGQISGAAGFLLLQYAIALGSVTLVNALQGLQYTFIFVGTIILSLIAPGVLRETLAQRILVQKALGLIVISAGLWLLL